MPGINEIINAVRGNEYSPRMKLNSLVNQWATPDPNTEPPRTLQVRTPPLYGSGPGVPPADTHFVPGEIQRGHFPAFNTSYRSAVGPREAKLLARDSAVVDSYAKYLKENGVSDEEMEEIIKDIVLNQKTNRAAEYEQPVELKLEDRNPKARR